MRSWPTQAKEAIAAYNAIDAIQQDPDWSHGDYTKQPRSAQFASVFYGIASNGGNRALQKIAPTRERADQLVNQRLKGGRAATLRE